MEDRKQLVKDIMTYQVVTCADQESLVSLAQKMIAQKADFAVVISAVTKVVVGQVTYSDVLKALAK